MADTDQSLAFISSGRLPMIEMAVAKNYEDPRAHAVRERYLDVFGGPELPVPVEAIAEDLLGLRIEQRRDMGDTSGMLLPAERLILLNAGEAEHAGEPIRRHRFTIAHEVGHWICHARGSEAARPTYCRSQDLAQDVDRVLEREANVFAAELLMPEQAVRDAWDASRDPDGVARALDVSLLAARWRLYGFGLVEDPPT